MDILLFQEGIQRAAYECPKCGRAQAVDGSCPLDGTHMESRDDGVDVAVHQTLAHGGTVHAVSRERAELDRAEGIAALLRF